MEEGLRACAQLAPEGIAAIGVDGWAVDYVRLGADGQPVADPFCYRDERNVRAKDQVHSADFRRTAFTNSPEFRSLL